jgi:hypothetical protein
VAGAAKVFTSKHPLRKLIWMSIFAVGLILTGFSVYGVINSYRAYGVNTAITVKQFSGVRLHNPKSTTTNANKFPA